MPVSTQSLLSGLFSRKPDPYADVDRPAARKWGALIFVLQSVLVAGLSPLSPPDERLGDAGWPILGGIVLAQLAIAWLLLRHGDRVGDNALLALVYLAVGFLALLQWLAGGYDSADLPIFLLWVVFIPASQPVSRVLPFLVYAAALAATPFIYEEWNSAEAAELVSKVAVWLALTIVVLTRMEAFRRERAGLSHSGQEAMKMAVTDPLTGLANRRAFAELAEREVSRAGRQKTPLTLVLADLDGFKEINDRHGHVNGDAYLQRVAEALEGMLREHDLGFRWGGDEFAILLPDTDRAAATGVCERLGGVVTATVQETAGMPLTLSFGMAEYAPEMTVGDMVEAADRDLLGDK